MSDFGGVMAAIELISSFKRANGSVQVFCFCYFLLEKKPLNGFNVHEITRLFSVYLYVTLYL